MDRNIVLYETTCIKDDIRKLYTGELEFAPLLYQSLMRRLETIRVEALNIKDGKDKSNLSSMRPNK